MPIREIDCKDITELVASLCISSNYFITPDIETSINFALANEISPEGKSVLTDISENIRIARDQGMAVCQDTGMAVVFVDMGQDVHIVGGDLNSAITDGIAKGYTEGFLRASVVGDPFVRENTGDNTPAVIHLEMVPGTHLDITVAPKGFGSENMSALAMLKPSDGIEGVKRFVLETIRKAGANPCPPIILGIGIGGTMEKAAMIAKRALLRDINTPSEILHIAGLELELLESINKTGIGPGGLGGRCTALSVNIETYPTHIAGLPVAINVSCHATRHASGRL